MKAWIDQTRGYWNAGYDVAPYTYGVYDNSLGIKGVMKTRIYLYYMQLFRLAIFKYWTLFLDYKHAVFL